MERPGRRRTQTDKGNIKMTIEEEFFKSFGIEKISKCSICMVDDCCYCQHNEDYIYPEITAEKLLQLICIISQYKYVLEDLYAENINELKKNILTIYIKQSINEDEKTKNQVKALFEE